MAASKKLDAICKSGLGSKQFWVRSQVFHVCIGSPPPPSFGYLGQFTDFQEMSFQKVLEELWAGKDEVQVSESFDFKTGYILGGKEQDI